MWTAILAASAAILGSMTAGFFNVAIQRGARKTDSARWAREYEQKRSDRLYDQRVRVYTDFLDEASNAFGYESTKVTAKYQQVKQDADKSVAPKTPHIEILARATVADSPEFNQLATMRMSRTKRTVEMLTESADVKEAAEDMWKLLLSMISLDGSDSEVNDKFFTIYRNYGKAASRFTRAVHIELTR